MSEFSDLASMAYKMDNYHELLEFLSACLEFIFSWIILVAISIIIAGKYLSRPAKLSDPGKQLFRIKIPPMSDNPILELSAHDDEVIVGFTGYIITLLFIGFLFGQDAHHLFSNRFGVNPGQWNSLSILSSMLVVAWACLTHLLIGFLNILLVKRRGRISKSHDRIIEKLAQTAIHKGEENDA